jgi:hypothetical protein
MILADPYSGLRDVKPILLWDAWLFAEAEASLMLEAWLSAPPTDKAFRHAGYRAALDREEHAARVLAERMELWGAETVEAEYAGESSYVRPTGAAATTSPSSTR